MTQVVNGDADAGLVTDAEWVEACAALATFAEGAGLLARLADQATHLAAWVTGDTQAGTLAADALDQLSGLLDDKEFVGARRAVAYLLRTLPPGLDT